MTSKICCGYVSTGAYLGFGITRDTSFLPILQTLFRAMLLNASTAAQGSRIVLHNGTGHHSLNLNRCTQIRLEKRFWDQSQLPDVDRVHIWPPYRQASHLASSGLRP